MFPATFDAAAEEVVCADAGHVQLSDLVRRSLVLYDESTKRYRLHDLARLFADPKLSAEERAVGQKRFATHYRDVLAVADELYGEGGESLLRGLALFDLEWGNIQAGHTWVVAQGVMADEGVVLLGIAYPIVGAYILLLRQHPRERIRWLEVALTATRRAKDRVGEGSVLSNLGLAYAALGETERAVQFYQQDLTIARELGYRKGEGGALGNLGVAYAVLGETRRAIASYEQYLAIAQELADHRGEGNALNNLGLAYAALRRTKRAIEFYEQALVIFRRIGDRRGEGNALGNLGLAYANRGETKRAIQFYEQTLLIHREIGDCRGEGLALWNIALALDQLRLRGEAIQYAKQSLVIFEQIENPYAMQVRVQLAAWREQTNT